MAERHPANNDFVLGNIEKRSDDAVKIGKRRLGTGMETLAPRGDHDRSQEDAKIEPASDFEILIQREDHADGCAEELVVPHPGLLGALEVALGDAKQAVHAPADLAPPSKEWLAPADGIVIPFALVRLKAVAGDRIEYRLRQTRLGVARNHPDAPGLDVAAAGASAGEPQQFLDRGPLDEVGEESTN